MTDNHPTFQPKQITKDQQQALQKTLRSLEQALADVGREIQP